MVWAPYQFLEVMIWKEDEEEKVDDTAKKVDDVSEKVNDATEKDVKEESNGE